MAAVDDTTEQTMSADLTTLRPLAGDKVGEQKNERAVSIKEVAVLKKEE